MKEQDYIEQLIGANLDALNDAEPADGHFERFELKLQQQKQGKVFRLQSVLKVAAAVVFVLLAVNQARIYLLPEKPQQFTLANVSPEYREVEFYYTNAINSGINDWKSLADAGLVSEEEQQAMKNELRDFEQRFQNLQAELSANPNDERVINAMLEYYQAKLSVITMIVTKLQEAKRQNNTKHEIEI